ncbi:hypothetical protein SNOG_16129 [Parastagonospora nodorum SN15]|nr:hypothetical protein SNOG_16129 [Parastagonospora nodorum SN15]EAT76501.2 hypothetical protein SNOG_16129 [Parastagonospora nodorum SN15]
MLRWPAALFILIVILTCELSILRRQPPSLPIGGEINGLVPHFSMEKKIFRADDRYASDHLTIESINATKDHWKDLMPRGSGFMHIQDYKKYTLPPPMHFDVSPGKELFAIAVFHQLHCLMHISAFLDKLTMKIRNREWTLDEQALAHNDHCFNYIRSALMCAADTTLEGQAQSNVLGDAAGTDGTGAVHICRNFDEVSAWAEKRRETDGKEHL